MCIILFDLPTALCSQLRIQVQERTMQHTAKTDGLQQGASYTACTYSPGLPEVALASVLKRTSQFKLLAMVKVFAMSAKQSKRRES